MSDAQVSKIAPRVTPKPLEKPFAEEPEQFVEVLNMGGLVMQKTVDPKTGVCKTEVLKQPMMSAEEVRATAILQKRRGVR